MHYKMGYEEHSIYVPFNINTGVETKVFVLKKVEVNTRLQLRILAG